MYKQKDYIFLKIDTQTRILDDPPNELEKTKCVI